MDERSQFDELCFYTLSHVDPAFVHQHVVDAWAAQHAEAATKPITITFALVGLYLHLERGFTGRQVQLAHMRMAKHRRQWLTFAPPEQPATMTITDVVAVPPGPERDRAIDLWCAAVWHSWQHTRPEIIALLKAEMPERIWE